MKAEIRYDAHLRLWGLFLDDTCVATTNHATDDDELMHALYEFSEVDVDAVRCVLAGDAG